MPSHLVRDLELEEPHRLTLQQLKAFDVFTYWSPKMTRNVYCLKEWTYRLGVHLESRPDVIAYSERPWFAEKLGKRADYVALFQSRSAYEKKICSCFGREQTSDASTQQIGDHLDTLAQSKGLNLFRFNESADATKKFEVDIAIQMLPYVIHHKKRGNLALEVDIKSELKMAGGQTEIGHLEKRLSGESVDLRGALFTLHFGGILRVDLARHLTAQSIVTLLKE